MQVSSYEEAIRFAHAVGTDAANKAMRKAGRAAWSEEDRDTYVEAHHGLMREMGYGWAIGDEDNA